jgi:hypothetical protein
MRGHIGEKLPDDGETFFFILGHPVRVAGNFGVNLPASKLIVSNLFADCQLQYARAVSFF